MPSETSFFKSIFKCMPTPAFVVEKATGDVLEYNNSFSSLVAHSSHNIPTNWQQLSKTTTSLEQWQTLIAKLEDDKKLRIQDTIKLGQDTLHTDLELQSIDEKYLLICIYSTEHINLAIAENNLLKFVLSESTCGFWVWDTETDYIECSQQLCQLLGCSQEDSPKSTEAWHKFVHPDDVADLKAIVEQHIEDGTKGYQACYRIINANNEPIWIKERGCAYLRNSHSQIIKSAGFIENIHAQKELEHHLRKQATFDEVTGLLTHAAAMTHFNKQLELSKRQYTQLSMVKINMGTNDQINLDEFIQNDKDVIVKKTAEILYNTIRNSDILARVSSGQLLLLLPNTNMQNAQNLLIRLTKKVEELELILEDDKTSTLSIRVGIATFPEDGENIEELSENANLALETCLSQTVSVTEL